MMRWLLIVFGWIVLMFACLQVERIPMGHAICGDWGCGPPTEALMAMHLFWFAAILPPWLLFLRSGVFGRKSKWIAGASLTLVAVIGLVVFLFHDLSVNQAYYEAGFWLQRYFLSLASLVEVPMVQLLAAGLVALTCKPVPAKPIERKVPAT